MPMVTLHKVGEGNLYHLHVLDPTDPGFGHPGGGVDPGYGQGRPGMRPDQGLPGGGHISNRPPGSGGGGIPDNELPDAPPPQLAPGWVLVLIRGGDGKWNYAALAPGSPPPRPLPAPTPPGGQPPTAGQPLPGGPNYPTTGPVNPPVVGGGPAPQPPQYPTGQPVPPTATPTRS